MQSTHVASARSCKLLALAKELPVHGDEQLLAVLPKASIAADGLDHVQAGLVVACGDWQVAEKSGQAAWLQLQGALQVWDLGGDRQGTAGLPLRHGGLADSSSLAQLTLREPAPAAGLDEHAPELSFLRCGRQGRHSLVRERLPWSMAQPSSSMFRRLDAVPTLLDDSPTTLYRALVPEQYKGARLG
jgi:hypothetical protein